MSMVNNNDFKITKGRDKLSLYQFHNKVAKHFFAQIVEYTLIIILDLIQRRLVSI